MEELERIVFIVKLPPEKRYNYFLKTVAKTKMLYGLFDDKDRIGTFKKKGIITVPIWPEAAFPYFCRKGKFRNYEVMSVSLEDFIKDFSPNIEKEGYAFSVFLSPDGKYVERFGSDLIKDIQKVSKKKL